MERLSDSLRNSKGAGIQSWFTISCSSKYFSAAISIRSLFVIILVFFTEFFLPGWQTDNNLKTHKGLDPALKANVQLHPVTEMNKTGSIYRYQAQIILALD